MTVGIVGGGMQHYQLVYDKLIELVEDSGVYLFNIFSSWCGANPPSPQTSISYRLATELGAPHKIKQYDTLDQLIQGICKEVDYLIILNDNSQPIKRLFMSYKQTGKHGSMIEL